MSRPILLRAVLATGIILPWTGETAWAQLSGQRFEVIPPATPHTVGDSVILDFRVHLSDRDLLLDSVPHLIDQLPPGVRVLEIRKLSRAGDRVFRGQATLAFYRPGRRPVPSFGLNFMRVVEGITRATLPGDSATVEISGILPAGNPALEDIKETAAPPPPSWPLLVLALLFLGAAAALSTRRARPVVAAALLPEPEPAAEPGAYELALAHLDRVEQERWPERGQVARHYEEVVQALREYLEAAEDISAHPRTSLELLWALPPHLTGHGLRSRCHEILTEADLVKFAAQRPEPAAARLFIRSARDLLHAWHGAGSSAAGADALR